jgi:uncharacterized protein YbjT (DUF2867 family)
LTLLPVLPVSGSGRAAYQLIWAADVARCVVTALGDGSASGGDIGTRRFELAGPEVLTCEQMTRTSARAAGRERSVVHLPLAWCASGWSGCAASSARPCSPPGKRPS